MGLISWIYGVDWANGAIVLVGVCQAICGMSSIGITARLVVFQ